MRYLAGVWITGGGNWSWCKMRLTIFPAGCAKTTQFRSHLKALPPIQRLRHLAHVRDRQARYLVRLSFFGGERRPFRRFFQPVQGGQSAAQAAQDVRSGWVDFTSSLGRFERVLPPVLEPKYIGLADPDPTVLFHERPGAVQALAGPSEVAQTRPGNGVGCEPAGLQLRIVATQIRILFESPQCVDQVPPPPAIPMGVEPQNQVGGIPPVCLPEEPSRKARPAEPCSEPASENKLIRRQAFQIDGGAPVSCALPVGLQEQVAIVKILDFLQVRHRASKISMN